MKLKTKVTLLTTTTFLLGTIGLSSAFYVQYAAVIESRIKRQLTQAATVVKSTINQSGMKDLYEEDSRQTEYYRTNLKRLSEIRDAFGMKYAYVMDVRGPDDFIFLFDTANYEPDEHYDPEAVTFLDPYDDAPNSLKEAVKTGSLVIADEPYTDQWGTFRSAFLPVKNERGEVVAAIGVDLDISDLLALERKALIFTAVAIAIALILALLMAVSLNRWFLKPVTHLVEVLHDATSNLDLSVRYDLQRKDELGDLAESLNDFSEKLGTTVSGISTQSEELAASSEELSATSNQFSENAQSQAASAEQITASIEQIAASMKQVSDGARMQSDGVKDLQKKVEDLYKSIQSSSDKLSDTRDISQQITGSAHEGSQKLEGLRESMGRVLKSSEDMNMIIDIINEISEKINLLSLNASIEAARAGDAGRGFAIVAGEVSRLADETAKSVNSISELLESNTREITEGQKNLSATTESFQTISSHVSQIYTSLQSVGTDVESQREFGQLVDQSARNIENRAREITTSIAEQESGVNEITQSISSISQIAERHSEGASEIASNADSVARISESLRNNIQRFKI